MKKLINIDNFLLDMDGTIYLDQRPIDGSVNFIKTLTRKQKSFLLFTNNSSTSSSEYLNNLSAMGINVEPKDIFTSAAATILYLQRQNAGLKIYLLATPSVEAEFQQAGFNLTDDSPDYVVLTFDKSITYKKLEQACKLLLSGVPFIATHPDLVCPTENLPIPDCGAMTKMITAATGISPKVIGKPNPEMIASALERLQASPKNTAIVGDRLYTDMEMGYRAGLTTVLVLSGETTLAEVQAAERQPDFILPSVRELTELIH